MTLGFTLPLYVFLLGQTIPSVVLLLPLPLCKPGVVFIRFATTPVGRSIFATAVLFLVGAHVRSQLSCCRTANLVRMLWHPAHTQQD